MPGRSAPSYARAASLELPLHQPAAPAASTVRDGAWLRHALLARWLAWASLAWLCIEGSIGVLAGVLAGRSRSSASASTAPSKESPA
jgi:hypothetical protein